LERALILGQSPELQPEDFYLASSISDHRIGQERGLVASIVDQMPAQLNLRETMLQLEKALISRALDLSGGVQAEAARRLGLSRSDLGYKIGRLSLTSSAEKPEADGGKLSDGSSYPNSEMKA
jgi:transcriptional regulator with GAF, ATPase, and Fis domain